MLRIARAVAVGGGAGLAVGGALYVWQQQKLALHPQPVHLCSEWGFDTRNNVLRAGVSVGADDRVRHLEHALDSLVSPTTNLATKSAEWLGSYGDLLRSLALARSDARAADADVLEPLYAAKTVPFGSPALMAAGSALAFTLTRDETFLSPDLAVPDSFGSATDLKYWAPLALARAKTSIAHAELQPALAGLVRLHRAASSLDDPLCFRPTAGGYIAQLLWRLGRPEEARAWLLAGEREAAKCGTPACKETTSVLRALLAKAAKQ